MKFNGYELCRFYLRCLFYLFFVDIEAYFEEEIPEKGVILASNHFSNLDPVILMKTIPRRISFVAKKELLKVPVLAQIMKNLEMIPINRQAFSPGTIKLMEEKIEKWNILIFPEGTRSKTGELSQAKQGFGYMVKRLEADVIPIFIDSYHVLPKYHFFPKPGTIKIKIGKRLHFKELYDKIKALDDKMQYKEIGNIVMGKISELKENL